MENQRLEPPPTAYEYGTSMGRYREAPENKRLFPEWYLDELVNSYEDLIRHAQGDAEDVIRSLSNVALSMHHSVPFDQRFGLGRRLLASVVGEEATLPEINKWLTVGTEDGTPSFNAITALAGYISGTAPDIESEDEVPNAEQESGFDTVAEGLGAHEIVYAVGVFAAVDEALIPPFIDHFMQRGSHSLANAVVGATAELQRMLDQYDNQVSDDLRHKPRYKAVRNLVQGLIGYDGRPPRSITQVLVESPDYHTTDEMRKAQHQVISMLKEMLRCEVNRDPENVAKLQEYRANYAQTTEKAG